MNQAVHRLAGRLAPALSLVALLAACGGGGGGGTSATPQGTLHMSLTDAPSCGYDNVNISIQKVRVNQSATASDTDAGWYDIDVTPAQRTDLLSLTNGVLQDLGQTTLPAGHYTQMRLVLAANGSSAPYANSVTPTGGSETALTTPSAQTSGLKANVDLTVNADQTADFVIDFDACRSIVKAGNSGQYLLKPVLEVTPQFLSGARGYVDATLANSGTVISLQQGGAVVKATTPDATGQFTLTPVAPGTYDLVISAPGRVTEVITGVTITDGTLTLLDASTAPFTLDVATAGTAAGVATAATSPILVTVSATQTLANGDVVEVASANVDGTTGAYALALPAQAPMVAAWSSSGSLTFAADTTAGTKYTLDATDGTTTKTAGPVTITAGATVTTNFAF